MRLCRERTTLTSNLFDSSPVTVLDHWPLSERHLESVWTPLFKSNCPVVAVTPSALQLTMTHSRVLIGQMAFGLLKKYLMPSLILDVSTFDSGCIKMTLLELTLLWIQSKLTTSPLHFHLLQNVNHLLSDTASWTFFCILQIHVGVNAEMSPTSHDSAHVGHSGNY